MSLYDEGIFPPPEIGTSSSSSSDGSYDDVLYYLNLCVNVIEQEAQEEVSAPKRRKRIYRDRENAHQRLMKLYFVENPCFPEVLHKRHPITSLINRKTLTLEDFHHYLFNSELHPPIGSQVYQDMNAPLSHYFIYTGHNSYLTGNQLSSPCSDVPIIKALKRGVRVIELDLWPNSSKDNVHVLHGRCEAGVHKVTLYNLKRGVHKVRVGIAGSRLKD